jgi:hypothetical protein
MLGLKFVEHILLRPEVMQWAAERDLDHPPMWG